MVFSVEENFAEVNRKDDSNQLLECAMILVPLQETEISIDDVRDLVFIKLEDFLQNLSDFVQLKQ